MLGLRFAARHPHAIIAIGTGIVVLVGVALGILGWQLASRQSDLEQRRQREQLEQAADIAIEGFLKRLAEVDAYVLDVYRRPDFSLANPPVEAPYPASLQISFRDLKLRTSPSQLLYVPIQPIINPWVYPFDAALLTPADLLEFRDKDLTGAATLLRQLTSHPNVFVRAEARLRLARVERKSGHSSAALEIYAKLGTEDRLQPETRVPYALLARFGRCELLRREGQSAQMMRELSDLLADLDNGRWSLSLSRNDFVWYRRRSREMAGLAPDDNSRIEEKVVLSELADWVFTRNQENRTNGRRVRQLSRSGDTPAIAILAPDGKYVVLFAQKFLDALLFGPNTPVQPYRLSVFDESGALVAALLPAKNFALSLIQGQDLRESPKQGKVVFPLPTQSFARAHTSVAVRSLAEADLPWRMLVAPREANPPPALYAGQLALFGALGAIVLTVAGACYFMARGVLREAAAARLQADFVAAVSHEFRSPLTTLSQFTEMIADGRVPGESRQKIYIQVMQQETGRLRRLVEDLLDFGRINAGRLHYRRELLSFARLVEDEVIEFRQDTASVNRRIEFISGGDPLPVEVDCEALRRVVRNLLENAVKYSPGDSIVSVETGCLENSAFLRVRDEGMGIPSREQVRIFDKFVRGEEAKRACIPGTGIGLALVREIVQAHGGSIQVQSEVGRGSTFQVRLPLARNANGGAA